MNGELIGFFRY